MTRRSSSGVTLIEVLIAVSLLSLLSLGILFSLRVGMNALDKANRKLMANRRVAGAQRILQQQLAGFIPVIAEFAPGDAPGVKIPFFQGRAQSMRFGSWNFRSYLASRVVGCVWS
jgi:prepilin-type N-terminal cleavage/methylation domain-containing protein